MKTPSNLEHAALTAAFSLANRKRRKKPVMAAETAEVWNGWHFCADELIDSAGNRYGQSEIRAIFFTRKLLENYRNEIKKIRLQEASREPVQLCLNLTPMWQLKAKW